MSPATGDGGYMVAAQRAKCIPVNEYDTCPVSRLVRRLGERWVLVILSLLAQRPHRFGELRRRIETISQRMLTRTLRSLEGDGLVVRTEVPGNPVGIEYAMTYRAQALLKPLSELAMWALEPRASAMQ